MFRGIDRRISGQELGAEMSASTTVTLTPSGAIWFRNSFEPEVRIRVQVRDNQTQKRRSELSVRNRGLITLRQYSSTVSWPHQILVPGSPCFHWTPVTKTRPPSNHFRCRAVPARLTLVPQYHGEGTGQDKEILAIQLPKRPSFAS